MHLSKELDKIGRTEILGSTDCWLRLAIILNTSSKLGNKRCNNSTERKRKLILSRSGYGQTA